LISAVKIANDQNPTEGFATLSKYTYEALYVLGKLLVRILILKYFTDKRATFDIHVTKKALVPVLTGNTQIASLANYYRAH
jgi:hypothetical protein